MKLAIVEDNISYSDLLFSQFLSAFPNDDIERGAVENSNELSSQRFY